MSDIEKAYFTRSTPLFIALILKLSVILQFPDIMLNS